MDDRGTPDNFRPDPAPDASAPSPAAAEPPAEAPPRRRTGMIVGIVLAAALVLGVGAYLLFAGGGPAIETPEGTLLLEKAELTSSWPKGCTPSATDPSCLAAEPGFQVLAVALVPEEEIEGGAFGSGGPAPDTGKSYVTDSSGGRWEVAATSFDNEGRWVLLFAPSTGASGFSFHHPGNDPIDLDV